MAKHQSTSIVYTVDLRVLSLEHADHVVGPRGDRADRDQADHARDHAERVEDVRDRQDAEAELGFYHEGNGAEESHLVNSFSAIEGSRG